MKLFKNMAQEITYRLAVHGIEKDTRPDGNALFELFINRCQALNNPLVLELGVKRSIHSRSTMHQHWVPNAGEYLGSDIEGGEDVDIVADIHCLTKITGEEQFDVIISCSTFEHFKYPHLAAHEVMKALRVGGILFIQTHQSYPIHAFPYDYFRYSREALAGLFGTQMGFNVLSTDYEFPVRIFSRNQERCHFSPAYLNVRLLGEKISITSDDYIYELDKI
jgi:SAM-dependent methyltransferase